MYPRVTRVWCKGDVLSQTMLKVKQLDEFTLYKITSFVCDVS
ncbi:hypothetical protein Aaci_3001 (plasmid) [Alicyclobacillus acidocaldarius subsp. acidocaldarius DSM 446]|uniref:Uncharacterized protein n=1 Tax=Alicyclobacillus acidocaldarius subsp. acidocaldarius (strain ATCC 27009 / DSM 446 / BCRC 14685 / JCM 5260 / KCTC 1825 / NBRC 15652 / NCIMB 11725 / NRRL B-14509 / 104-IA) TaxID=521098 RepID=C8WYB0_ALIAD|nr:hypothetical protein Aaci_3001 [Alicyclobacillus acidocaldarius subsp. acidocaldarius DSM 446]